MIFNDVTEFRRAFPTHDLDTIEPLQAQIEAQQADWLKERLGSGLLSLLEEREEGFSDGMPKQQLLIMAQNIVAYAVEGANANINAVQLNNSGINVVSNDEYAVAAKDAVAAFKADCEKETLKAVNRMLIALEEWAKEVAVELSEDADEDEQILYNQKKDIVTLWKQSRYFYQTEGLLINTATCLQEFVDFFENRDRFVSFLPDLRYIQETMVEDELGADLLEAMVTFAQSETLPDGIAENDKATAIKTYTKGLRMLRRAMSRELVARNRFWKDSSVAHDEYVSQMKAACTYLSTHQDYLGTPVKTAPFYYDIEEKPTAQRKFKNNRRGNAMFVMPGFN